MARVTGIGGIIFKSKDPEALKKWYRRHLGIESRKSDVGARFDWQESIEPHRLAYTEFIILSRAIRLRQVGISATFEA